MIYTSSTPDYQEGIKPVPWQITL